MTERIRTSRGPFSEDDESTWVWMQESDVPKTTCVFCGTTTKSKQEVTQHEKLSHAIVNANGLFECRAQECSKTYARFETMKRHFSYIHTKTPRAFSCNYAQCDYRSKEIIDVKGHVRNVHLGLAKRDPEVGPKRKRKKVIPLYVMDPDSEPEEEAGDVAAGEEGPMGEAAMDETAKEDAPEAKAAGGPREAEETQEPMKERVCKVRKSRDLGRAITLLELEVTGDVSMKIANVKAMEDKKEDLERKIAEAVKKILREEAEEAEGKEEMRVRVTVKAKGSIVTPNQCENCD